MKMVIVGPGRVGTALALACQAAGNEIVGAVPSQRVDSRSAKEFEALTRAPLHPWERAPERIRFADVVWITVPDRHIAQVAQWLDHTGAIRSGQVIAHTSGALTSDAIRCVHSQGAFAASFHPLQTFASPGMGPRLFEGITVAIEGERQATDRLSALAASLGAVPVMLDPQNKVRYHAAAVMASNALVALVGMAADLADLPTGLSGLLPLVQGAVDNLVRVGIPDALTGPIERGDAETVEQHLHALAGMPQAREVYAALGRVTVDMALAKGSIDEETARRLRTLL
ncbi:Rossmann-like and DUF2520 domain-containing protein [Alicyclobacillus acidiphilus]|uniref:Rossmann-like and DUF2520 domain-containing protein n=1 Tax=Alicyclobacillus acidiphilus TaxID=182455 RepID=UPI0008344ECD|nr:Rossmann-like and DUF2520 domain-containing protein [Alicyclobacillus acidiphilus]